MDKDRPKNIVEVADYMRNKIPADGESKSILPLEEFTVRLQDDFEILLAQIWTTERVSLKTAAWLFHVAELLGVPYQANLRPELRVDEYAWRARIK